MKVTPRISDVLFGRGGKNCKHVGNMKLRAWARDYRKQYSKASKRGKTEIAKELVKHVRSQDPPGRFLKRDDATGNWYEVKEVTAREKASQSLRDARDEESRSPAGKRLPEGPEESPFKGLLAGMVPCDDDVPPLPWEISQDADIARPLPRYPTEGTMQGYDCPSPRAKESPRGSDPALQRSYRPSYDQNCPRSRPNSTPTIPSAPIGSSRHPNNNRGYPPHASSGPIRRGPRTARTAHGRSSAPPPNFDRDGRPSRGRASYPPAAHGAGPNHPGRAIANRYSYSPPPFGEQRRRPYHRPARNSNYDYPSSTYAGPRQSNNCAKGQQSSAPPPAPWRVNNPHRYWDCEWTEQWCDIDLGLPWTSQDEWNRRGRNNNDHGEWQEHQDISPRDVTFPIFDPNDRPWETTCATYPGGNQNNPPKPARTWNAEPRPSEPGNNSSRREGNVDVSVPKSDES